LPRPAVQLIVVPFTVRVKTTLFYEAARSTVTLTPTKPFSLSKPAQLQVDGVPPSGLMDSFGRLIDGDGNGQPGGNALTALSRGGVKVEAIPSAQANHHTTETVSTHGRRPAERNALPGLNKAIRGDLDHGLLREARE